MTNRKPSDNEDEYFVRRDAELLQKQREAQAKAALAAERMTHFMKCPKCGANLITTDLHGVQIDRCSECGGLWLDNGELETLLRHEDPGFMGRVFGDLFTRHKKK